MDNKRDASSIADSVVKEVSQYLGTEFDIQAQDRLATLIYKTVRGSDEIILTPLGMNTEPDTLLNEWSEIFYQNSELLNDVLLEIEETQRDKFSPRSIQIPWSERKDSVYNYFSESNIDFSSLNCTPSDKSLSLRPISLQNVRKYIKTSTNAGLPSLQKKAVELDWTIDHYEEMIYDWPVIPCVLFTRTQEQRKTRAVFGYPLVYVLQEMRFYRPVLEFQKNLFWRSALRGPNAVASHLTHIIDQANLQGLKLVSIDFSAFDQSLVQDIQIKVGEYYVRMYQSSFAEEIREFISRKSEIPLVTPDGIIRGKHGEPSGSVFTNEDDSIAQMCIAERSNSIIDDLFDCQGDDGAYAIKEEDVSSFLTNFESYGLKVNKDKTVVSDSYLVYLQNLFHPDYRKDGIITGIYPTFRALNRLCYQERYSSFKEFDLKGSDYYSLRTLSILENCKDHPLFEKLVKFIISKDKYNLEVSDKGIANYVNFVSSTEGFVGDVVNQHGDDLKGIKSWESFKLVKRLQAQ